MQAQRSLTSETEAHLTESCKLRRAHVDWKLRTRTLPLGRRTLIMGVVNITPDSFSDGGSFADPEAAIAHALKLLDEGADLLDLGAESTRPGVSVGNGVSSTPHVSAAQEQTRLLPVVKGILAARPHAILSIDTYKSKTAQAALQAGAEIINDVSGLSWDPNLARVCADARCGLVLMHTRGRPAEWKAQSKLEAGELLAGIKSGLAASLNTATAAGVDPDAIVLDPGYGFGKRGEENFALLSRQSELLALNRPLLAGLSRKSFLGHALAPLFSGKPAPVGSRDNAGIAALVATILNGASLVRVHRVRESVEAALIADAIVDQIV